MAVSSSPATLEKSVGTSETTDPVQVLNSEQENIIFPSSGQELDLIVPGGVRRCGKTSEIAKKYNEYIENLQQ